MRVSFSVVPPGGGETDYGFEAELDALPSNGDYITVFVGDGRTHDFIVRKRWFYIERTGTEGQHHYSQKPITIEVEFALSPYSSDDHKRACERYAKRGKPPTSFEDSKY